MNTVMTDDAKKSNERELGNDCENHNVLGCRSILRVHLMLGSIPQQPNLSLNALPSLAANLLLPMTDHYISG